MTENDPADVPEKPQHEVRRLCQNPSRGAGAKKYLSRREDGRVDFLSDPLFGLGRRRGRGVDATASEYKTQVLAERAAAARAAHEQNMFHDKQHGPKKRRRCCGGGCLKCVSYAFPWLHELLLHAEPASGKTPLMLTMAALRMTKRDAQPGRAKNHRASRFRRPEQMPSRPSFA